MSHTIISVFVQFAVVLLPLIGVDVGTEQLTQAIQTFVLIATGVWIYLRRLQVGDVTPLGQKV